MAIYKKSIYIPVLVSLLVSGGIFTTLLYFQSTPTIDSIVNILSIMSLIILALFILYAILAQMFQIAKISIWAPGVPIGLLVYFGALIIFLSYFEGLAAKMTGWDINMILGIAVIAIGLSLIPRYGSLLPEDTLNRLKELTDDLESRINTLGKTEDKLEDVMESVFKTSHKYFENLTGVMEKSKKKEKR